TSCEIDHVLLAEICRQRRREKLRKMTRQRHGRIVLARLDTFHRGAAVVDEPGNKSLVAIDKPLLAAKQIGARRRQSALVRAGHRMSRHKREASFIRDFAKRQHHAAYACRWLLAVGRS